MGKFESCSYIDSPNYYSFSKWKERSAIASLIKRSKTAIHHAIALCKSTSYIIPLYKICDLAASKDIGNNFSWYQETLILKCLKIY